MLSASDPATRPNSTIGPAVAVCTRATITADVDRVAISQAARVPCMVYPSAVQMQPM